MSAWYIRGQRQLQVGSGFKRMVGMNPLLLNLEDFWVSIAYPKFGMEPAESVDRVLVCQYVQRWRTHGLLFSPGWNWLGFKRGRDKGEQIVFQPNL